MRRFAHFGEIEPPVVAYVPESRFGVWFLSTSIWKEYVVVPAIDDLARLAGRRLAPHPVIVDVGCGAGHAFKPLHERFAPGRLIGVDVDPAMLAAAAAAAAESGIAVELRPGTGACLPLADQRADVIFCHQTFHHFIDQEGAIREFHRVLRPGGLLLFAESTKAYIHSWIIRLLFRHPMEVQKTAAEYLELIRGSGFAVAPAAVSYPYLWWSRPDFGISEHWFGIRPPVEREETMLNLIAVRS
jgi:ubiquinone/menaquinone biosynthesis C-methylase UbiE